MKKVYLAKLALLIVAIVWGSSLVVVKASTDTISPNFLLALRFTIAGVILSIIFYKRLRYINWQYIKSGFIIGICLFIAYCSQTIGVMYAMPGKSAFLSASYCVIVPFLIWAIDRKKPNKYNMIAAFLCIIGIGISTVSFNLGDSLAILSAFLFALHIVFVAKFGKEKDPILITIIQFGFSAVFSWIVSFALETPSLTAISSSTISGILYLALACTALSLLLQNLGQKYASPSSTSLILSLESVFGVLFSVIFFNETIDYRLAAGFTLILLAVVIAETKLEFLRDLRIDKRRKAFR